jgi:hypothetical protein
MTFNCKGWAMAEKSKTGEGTSGKPSLRQDPLVDKLRSDPTQPPVIGCRGYLGRSEKPDCWRLYLTRALTDYFEIAETDIVHQESLATERDPDAGSRIWIKETATLTRVSANRVPARALVTDSLSAGFGIGPLGRLMLAPLLPWATAAGCWIALFSAFEKELLGQGLAVTTLRDAQDIQGGNVISLRRCDYEILV